MQRFRAHPSAHFGSRACCALAQLSVGVDLHTAAPCLIRSPRVARISGLARFPSSSWRGSKANNCTATSSQIERPLLGVAFSAMVPPKGPKLSEPRAIRIGRRILSSGQERSDVVSKTGRAYKSCPFRAIYIPRTSTTNVLTPDALHLVPSKRLGGTNGKIFEWCP